MFNLYLLTKGLAIYHNITPAFELLIDYGFFPILIDILISST